MSVQVIRSRPEPPQELIRLLQRELADTNREVLALTLELEKRVEDRTAALQLAQKELERKNARLEAANKELDAFSYSVSHDLRAPLRHLHGWSTALREDFQESLDERGREYLSHITKAVEQMGSLIDALLRFARTAQQPLNQTEISFDQLVREVIAELEPEQAGRRIEWKLRPLPVVRGDLSLLRQVWANLIGNAIKYTRQKDPAHIEIGSLDDSEHELV